MWNFYITDGDVATQSAQAGGAGPLGSQPVIAGAKLKLVEEGSFEPKDLFRSRMPWQNAAATPTAPLPSPSAPDASNRTTSRAQPHNAAGAGSTELDHKIVSKSVSDNDRAPTFTAKAAYEHFCTALLSTLSASFCQQQGAVPLNYRTVLLRAGFVDGGPSRGTLNCDGTVTGAFTIYLTTNGSLVLGLALSVSQSLASIDEISSNGQVPLSTQVLTAPFGVLGIYQGLATGYLPDALGQTPDNRLWLSRPNFDARSQQWRDICTRLLKGRGISEAFLDKCAWIALQLSRRRPDEQKLDGSATPGSNPSTVISWPSGLCFWRRRFVLDKSHDGGGALARHAEETSDLLLEAKVWLQSESERGEILSQRRVARDTARAAKESQANPTAAVQPSASSPLESRRGVNATASAAAGAMYPTPPDGVQNPTAPTPAPGADAITSSPNEPTSMLAAVDTEMTMNITGAKAVPDADAWDPNPSKRERADSFLEGDNLFGDMGTDMFGDADITDADFSFFDEQPDNDALDLSDMPPMPNLVMHEVPVTQPGLRPPSGDSVTNSQKPIDEDDSKDKMPPPSISNFIKPEIRHARSSLPDESGRMSISSRSSGIKREASPFDPDTVFKKVRASVRMDNVGSGAYGGLGSRKGSIFDGVEFDPDLPLANKKYEAGGRFDCQFAARSGSESTLGGPPTTDYLRRHSKSHQKHAKSFDQTNALLRTVTGNLEQSTIQGSPDMMEDMASDADDVSVASDAEALPEPLDEPTSPLKSSARRLNVEDDMASQATSLKGSESIIDDSDPSLALELPKLARAEATEVAVTRYFDSLEPFPARLSLSDDDIITVAQILTDQAASGKIGLRDLSNASFDSASTPEMRRQLSRLAKSSTLALQQVASKVLGNASQSSFKGLIDVTDLPLLGPTSRFQPRPVPSKDPNAEPPKPSSLYSIPVPHLELKRMDAKLSVLPSSIAFWDTLGLGPSQGTKDISAVCVLPNHPGLADFAAIFLDHLRHTYEFFKLGSFETLPSNSTTDSKIPGVVTWDAEPLPSSPNSAGIPNESGLDESMRLLDQCLLNSGASATNVVVFGVYSPKHPDSVVDICAAFHRLFERHKKSLAAKRQVATNELVLQLLPIDSLSSLAGLPYCASDDLVALALETYDRCTMFGGPMPAPAIILEQSVPRGIDFRLSNAGSSSLMHENTCMHIAYAQSVDERWITAAWTDNRGSQQMTASYNLGRRGKPLASSFNDVAHEIWETTHDLISRWKVHWRVIITKCGHMQPSEVEFWIGLAQTESHASVSLTLIAADTNPSLQLLPPSVKVPAAASNSFYTTPASTPQPSTVSPDQGGNPATPMKEASQLVTTPSVTPGGVDNNPFEPADGDAILIDATDQTWGAVLSHRLSTSPSAGQLSAALVSGYLVKRGGKRDEDPPVMMEVDILHTDGNPRALEGLMREVLSIFRGLGTLARARNTVERETDVRPWHVAAAEKAVRALYLLM